jgi:hypothetical protein
MASSPQGAAAFGPASLLVGFAFCLIVGFVMRDRITV